MNASDADEITSIRSPDPVMQIAVKHERIDADQLTCGVHAERVLSVRR